MPSIWAYPRAKESIMNLFEKPASVSAGRRLAAWSPVVLMIIAVFVTQLGPFTIKQQFIYYLAMLLIFGPILIRGAEKNGKISENTYLSIIAKSTYLAGVTVLPLRIFGTEWHVAITIIVIWCAVVFFVLNNDLYGEFNPVLYWSESNADGNPMPGPTQLESEQDGSDEQGDDGPPTVQ